MKNQQGVSIQYCAKVMQAKCANFVVCSRELSTKVSAKVRAKIRGVSSENTLEQRAIFLRIFGTSQKIRDISLGTELLSASVPARFSTQMNKCNPLCAISDTSTLTVAG